jgi:acetamidase/formamidase
VPPFRPEVDYTMNTVLNASPKTCHWGFFDAALAPALTIESGDEVTIDTISGGPQNLPGTGFQVPPELLELHAAGVPAMPGHILTGPVAVTGAMPGDALQVNILDISLSQDWGFNFIAPLKDTLPNDFQSTHQTIIPLDATRGVATLPWGLELKLAPFFGVMGVAPPPTTGAWRQYRQ